MLSAGPPAGSADTQSRLSFDGRKGSTPLGTVSNPVAATFTLEASALRASAGAMLRFWHMLRSAKICAARPHADYRGVGPQ